MDHAELRADLAATFRWCARLGLNEGVANHFSAAINDDGNSFLVNPEGKYWSTLKASDLLVVDANEPDAAEGVDRTALAIHGALHRQLPQARVVMHLHSRYATVLSTLKEPTIPPIDQTSMRFFNRVAVDAGYDGMGLDDEAERLATCLGNHSILMMGQHGVLVVGQSVGECFDLIYYFERAAETYILALQTGQELNVAADAVAEKTAQQWDDYEGSGDMHLAAIREVLDVEEPSYLN
ncbi:MAG: class II aldolase and adducin N-terminal domain-containing protein [Pseudomonadota bacterium]